MRVGYFGPEGTFTQEALIAAMAGIRLQGPAGEADDEVVLVPLPTIYGTVMAVHAGTVQRALVPIENSLEGSVNATLDALVLETDNVVILGEVVHPIRHCLIARTALELSEIEAVVSHPQANAQCAGFIRSRLPQARVLAGSSTAEAVRMVADHDGPWAALGNHLAAERYGCQVLRAGVEDMPGNETRFVWLGPVGAPPVPARQTGHSVPAQHTGQPTGPRQSTQPLGPWKTAIVFWGVGSESPGWLVACLAELADREVNLTRIESRPRRQGLGRYMFFADLEGRDSEARVGGALAALQNRVEALRVLGSFPAA